MSNLQLVAALLLLAVVAFLPWRWALRSAVPAARPCPTGWAAIREGTTERVVCLDRPPDWPPGCQTSARDAGRVVEVDPNGTCRPSALEISASRRLALGLRLDVNTEPVSGLLAVPGLGPKLAERVVESRPFTSLVELERIRGIGPRKRTALARFLAVVGPDEPARPSGRRGRRRGRRRRTFRLPSLPKLLEAPQLRDHLQVFVHRLLMKPRVADGGANLPLERGRFPGATFENELIGLTGLTRDGRVGPVDGGATLGRHPVAEPGGGSQPVESAGQQRVEEGLGGLGFQGTGGVAGPSGDAMLLRVGPVDGRRLRRKETVELLQQSAGLRGGRLQDGGRVLLDDGVSKPMKRAVRGRRLEILLTADRQEGEDETTGLPKAGGERAGPAAGDAAGDVDHGRHSKDAGGRSQRDSGGRSSPLRPDSRALARRTGRRQNAAVSMVQREGFRPGPVNRTCAGADSRNQSAGGGTAPLQTENTSGTSGPVTTGGPQPDLVRLKQGDTVGSRFVIDERLRDDVIGTIYRAVDEKSGRKIVIVMLDGNLAIDRGATEDLRASIKLTSGLAHKNLVSVFGLGRESKRRYVAREYVDGQTLSELLEKKAEAGKSFTLKGAYNLIAHVCNALQFAAPHLGHGTLRPGNILINRTGRVKVADFGLAGLRPGLLERRDAMNRWDASCFPPGLAASPQRTTSTVEELHDGDVSIDGNLEPNESSGGSGHSPTGGAGQYAADDLYALGSILYGLLVGRPYALGKSTNGDAVRLPEGVEVIIRRCHGGDGVVRFRDANELKTELLHVIEANRGPDAERDGDGDGLPHESSIVPLDEVGTPVATAGPAAGVRPAPARPSPGKAAPRAPKRRPEAARDGGGFVIPELKAGGAVEDDGTTQRWLVEKSGVDYGPFTSKQIIEKLFSEELQAETNLYDIETDKRLPLSEHAVFDEALVSWIHEKAEREKRRAEEAREAAERRRSRLFLTVGAALLLIVGGVGGGIAWYQSTLPKPEKANLPSLVVRWQNALPQILLPDDAPETPAEVAERQRAKGQAVAQRRAAGEAKRLAEEERLAQSSELDASQAGTGRTFDQQGMNALVAERNPQIIKCLQDEIRRDPARRSFEIKATILPRGDIINIRMEGATPAGNGCVRSALGGLKVPPFDGTNQTLRLPFNISH